MHGADLAETATTDPRLSPLAKVILGIVGSVITVGIIAAMSMPLQSIDKRVDNLESRVNTLDTKREDMSNDMHVGFAEIKKDMTYLKQSVDRIDGRLQRAATSGE